MLTQGPMPPSPGPAIFEPLQAYIRQLDIASVPEARQQLLGPIAGWITARLQAGEAARLVFICTHNSRRSQLAQIWLHGLAAAWGVSGIESYSGGSEATAPAPQVMATLRQAGWIVDHADPGKPSYTLSCQASSPPLLAFSKVYDDPHNPSAGFAAVMVCNDAEAACPHVAGAGARFALPYPDPRLAEGTPDEAEAYARSCQSMATEMAWLLTKTLHHG